MALGRPPGGGFGCGHTGFWRSGLAVWRGIMYRALDDTFIGARDGPASSTRQSYEQGRNMVKVIASSLRKGNVVEQDGNLHVVLTAENVHAGKGNSITNVNM